MFIKTGRAFFGFCLIGLGAQQFQHGEFRPVFLPDWPAWLHNSVLAYIFGAALILAGGLIALAKNARKVALISAVVSKMHPNVVKNAMAKRNDSLPD